jgi:aminopeptidase N
MAINSRPASVFLAALLALSAAATAAARPVDPSAPPPVRTDVPTQLPRTVRPTHYDVSVTPEAGKLTFDGTVQIAIEVVEPTARITLNAIDLTFRAVRLSGGPDAGPPAPPRIEVDAAAQTATFTFGKALPRGRYQLAMDYSGKIGTQAVGLFALDYDSPDGRKRGLFTQFENSDARRFIPSWDEPAYRTTFALEVIVPSADMAVSNMPVAQRNEIGNGKSRVRFAPSPSMSTYLLFLAVGDLERATTRVGETEIGVVTKKGAIDQARFALDSSALVLREYNDYFGTPYPLPKLDNIAAPGRSQFFGAMENWGAIFTFEYALLIDPSISTEGDRQSIFEIAAHEISHQWFGNLVTMAWWDDLWLNEGFASWMAGRTTEKLHPEWDTALHAVASRNKAMERDALSTTHPVVQHVETVEQASQAFDVITYEKGEAVIRMLEGYVGADAWRSGVRRYIQRHAYGNTVSDDLWRDIEAAVGKPITPIAHDFTLQPGVPLVTVGEVACRDGASQVSLSQGELSKDRPDKKPLAWRVPVIVKSVGGGEAVRTVMEGGKASVTVPGCDAVIVNAGQSGYYRTLYAPPQFARIADRFPAVAPIDQLGLLLDSWALGRAGRQPASDALELARATPLEADPQIWGEIASIFASIDDYYRGDPSRRAVFRKFAGARLAPVFARTGWVPRPDEPATVAILRSRLISVLSLLGDRGVIDEARRRYDASATDPGAIPGSLRKVILGVVARHADAATWNKLHAAARGEKTPLVKENLYFLLAATADPGLARRALDLALTAEPGATISGGMIAEVAGEHPDLAFDFALAHMAAVNEKVDASSRSRYYAGLGGQSADPAMVGKLKAYATAHLDAKSRRDTDTAIARVEDRIRVRERVLPAIDAWLGTRGASADASRSR